MKRPNKTLRKRKQRRQRSRRHSHRRYTRRYRGGGLPVPAGSVVAISTGGEYGVPILMSKEKADTEKEQGSLED